MIALPNGIVVCASCQRLSCASCRLNPDCVCRCAGCGQLCCAICDEIAPAQSRLCACCRQVCRTCRQVVCKPHMRADGVCMSCSDAEFGEFDEARRQAWHSSTTDSQSNNGADSRLFGDGPWHVF